MRCDRLHKRVAEPVGSKPASFKFQLPKLEQPRVRGTEGAPDQSEHRLSFQQRLRIA